MGAFSTDSGCTLDDSLTAYWDLDESSGTRVDSVGSNDLTDNNTVGSVTGKQGNAASFDDANDEYLSIADNSDVSTGDIDFTIACWVRLDDKSNNYGIICKWGFLNAANSREYRIFYSSGADRFQFIVSSDGTATNEVPVSADNFGSPSAGTFYFILAYHDSVNNEIGIQVNNGTADTVSHSAGVYDGTASLFFGALDVSGAIVPNDLDGAIDEAGLWKRILTSQETSDLYNGGSGNTYDPSGVCTLTDSRFFAMFN